MCGIFGYIGSRANSIDPKAIIQSLKHRGPDDDGYILKDDVLLVHTRLSIIDLSPNGHQPMSNHDKSIWLVFNGEIYNYIELKRELHGYQFKTQTDTEVVIAAYEKWGVDFVRKLRGMFSLVLLDGGKRKVFCAVDRFGIKPFYFSRKGNELFFSSEIKTLAVSGVGLSADDNTIYDYMVLGRLNHSKNTFFKNVKQLRPSEYLHYDLDSHEFTIGEYWSIFDYAEQRVPETDLIDYVQDKLVESISIHLRSDVEYGLNLSSGLDSNFLRCLITKTNVLANPLKCFSFCFAGTSYDECDDLAATDVAGVEYFKTEVKSSNLFSDLEKIICAQEGPIGGAGVYAFWLNMKLVQQNGIKVILSGQGADELFCGYKYYYETWLKELYQSRRFEELEDELFFYNREHATNFTLDSAPFLNFVNQNDVNEMKASDGTLLNEHGYLSSQFLMYGKESWQPENRPGISDTKNRAINDLLYLKMPKLLRFQDKMSMDSGVEVRVPFLDHILFESVFRIPVSKLLKKGLTKYLLRKVAEKYSDPLNRPFNREKKIYMPTPQREWLKYELVDSVRELISSSQFADSGYVNKKKLLSEYNNYVSAKDLQNSFFIWKFINMETLFRKFF